MGTKKVKQCFDLGLHGISRDEVIIVNSTAGYLYFITEVGLEEMLKTVPDGQIVLLRKQALDNQSRQKLVKVIIDHLMFQDDPNHKFPGVLQQAAEEIVHLFPGERIESYYIPYSKKTATSDKIRGRGKLYSRFVNSKRALTLSKSSKSVEDVIEKKPTSLSEKEKASYNSLLYSTGDSPQQILNNWIISHRMRMMKMKTFETTLAYFNKFPPLRQPSGYQLLIEDFNIKYPNAKDKQIQKIWPPIAEIIIEILKGKQMQIPDLNCPNNNLILSSLKFLPWLFRPVVVRNKAKQRNEKLSRADMAESFLLHVPVYADLDSRISERTKKLKEFELSVQPFMVVVGPLEQVEAYFVVFDNQRYMFNDSFSILDTTFKIICALELPFPAECKGLWQLIDHLVYKINTYVDPCTSVVLGEIEHKLRK